MIQIYGNTRLPANSYPDYGTETEDVDASGNVFSCFRKFCY